MNVYRVLSLLFPVLLATCSSPGTSIASLPTPERACPSAQNWRGIIPGETTRREVRLMLGRPSAKGKVRYTDEQMSFDSYKVQEGTIRGLMDDRVFYRNDGVVAWIEAVVADRDGRTHKLQEIVDQLGSTLDQVYVNNNFRSSTQYDILAGPDQIYVWSECGFAAGAAPRMAGSVGALSRLVIRYPILVGDYSFQPRPNVEDEIVFMFIFPPTSPAGFEKFYKEKVPFHFYFVATQYFGHETE